MPTPPCTKRIHCLSDIICETDGAGCNIDTIILARSACPNGWLNNGDKCFYIEDSFGTKFSDAQTICKRLGGDLASIATKEDNDFLISRLNTERFFYWIGLTSEDWTPLQWNDGSEVSFTNWAPNEPNNPGREKCTALLQPDWAWNSFSCFVGMAFICSKHTEGRCPRGWLRNGKTCFYIEESFGTTFRYAQTYCKRRGGDLASITSKEDNDFLIARLHTQRHFYWVGLTSEDWTPLQWNDGSDVSFTNWAPNEPDRPRSEQCAAMYQPTWTWNSFSCYLGMAFICSAPAEEEACDSDWKTFEDYCYKGFDEQLNWNDAQAECVSLGGNLATIPNFGASDFVNTQLGLRNYGYWMGLTGEDLSSEPLHWVDGTLVTNTFWARGEPNDTGGNEDCVIFFIPIGEWNDWACSNQQPYICSKRVNGA